VAADDQEQRADEPSLQRIDRRRFEALPVQLLNVQLQWKVRRETHA